MKIETKIQVYEIDSEEITELDYPVITIKNHHDQSLTVNLQCEDGKVYNVLAKDLIKAIENATNPLLNNK